MNINSTLYTIPRYKASNVTVREPPHTTKVPRYKIYSHYGSVVVLIIKGGGWTLLIIKGGGTCVASESLGPAYADRPSHMTYFSAYNAISRVPCPASHTAHPVSFVALLRTLAVLCSPSHPCSIVLSFAPLRYCALLRTLAVLCSPSHPCGIVHILLYFAILVHCKNRIKIENKH